eukprot:747169-Hanusia_phi.AAC.2
MHTKLLLAAAMLETSVRGREGGEGEDMKREEAQNVQGKHKERNAIGRWVASGKARSLKDL